MTRLRLIITTLAFILFATLAACAHTTGPQAEASARLIGRRIGYNGTQLYPKHFIRLGVTANQACPQRAEKAVPADVAFSLIVKAIQEKTDDPFLAQDLKDILQILGIDLN
jgi:hypothetical protein